MLEWQYVRGQRPLSTVFFSSQCTVRQNLEQYLYFWGFGFVDLYFSLMLFTYPWLTTVQNAWMETELYLYCCVSVFFICIVVNLYFVQQKKILLFWTFLHRIYCRTWKNTQNFDHHHHHVDDDESVWKMTNSQTGDIFPISDLKLFRFASDVSIKYFWHFTTNLFFSILFVLSTYSLAGFTLHRQGWSLKMCPFWKVLSYL